jgi:hypothetical protein
MTPCSLLEVDGVSEARTASAIRAYYHCLYNVGSTPVCETSVYFYETA